MEKYDLIIVGAGPAGIFTAVELLRHGSKKKILLVEKGKPVEKRHCPKAELGHCVNCRPTCAITTGFSGAGAFSDGKLSLSYEVGGDLPTLIGEEFAQELIHYTDKIYLEFGADPHVEGIYTGEDIKEIRKNAIHAGLKLVGDLNGSYSRRINVQHRLEMCIRDRPHPSSGHREGPAAVSGHPELSGRQRRGDAVQHRV